VVREEDSHPRGRGFESRRILDGCKQFASYYIEEKLKIKVAKYGTPKKCFFFKLLSYKHDPGDCKSIIMLF
jgi:hypothetical protein